MADLRSMMATFPTGVGIVTAVGNSGRPWGMTCTSIASVALQPPCLLVCLRQGSPTLAAVLEHGGFALNLLHADAQADAELFASGAPDRFQRVRWKMDQADQGPHLPDRAHSTADCRVLRHLSFGDHTVVFGEVTAITQRSDAYPLMYGLHQFAQWPGAARRQMAATGRPPGAGIIRT